MNKESIRVIDGIKCYAPELAYENDDFKEESFDLLYQQEEKNFWFRSRNKVIQSLFRRYGDGDKEGEFLEIGCGNGFVLKGLAAFKNLKLQGAEIYIKGLLYAKKRLPDVEFVQLDATNLPFEESHKYIGAFDVLEHIEKDELVMLNVFKSVKRGGKFFISVPQYMFMWSYLDDLACHKRRYTKRELTSKLENAGFQIDYIGSFVFTLFPLMVLSRFLKKKNQEVPSSPMNEELELPGLLNRFLETILYLDLLLIRWGFRLPFGGSLICVATKPSDN